MSQAFRLARSLGACWLLGSFLSPLTAAPQCALEVADLEPPAGNPGDGFGYRVERSGDVAVIAATFADTLGEASGSASVWRREAGGGWKHARTLLASDGTAWDAFGYAVATDGERVLVGAPRHGHPLPGCGAVYVFARDRGGAGEWGEVAHFTPPSAGAGAQFGYALALRGERLLVGAPHHGQGVPGRAYLYRRDAGAPEGWTLERELLSADPATGFHFGQDVALGDGLLAVSGATADVLPYADTYVVHVRAEDAGGPGAWGEVRSLSSPSGVRDIFGWEIGLDGDRLVAVAPAEWNMRTNQIGALYLFRRDLGGPENWGLERRLEGGVTPGGLFAPDEVNLSGDWIVAGNGLAVTVFVRDAGGPDAWAEVARIQDDDPEPAALFGVDLALEGTELFVGAAGAYGSTASGEVYVYELARLARATWRNDAARANPDVHRARSRPILGGTYTAEVDLRGTPHARATLMTFARPAEALLPGGQVLLGGRPLALVTATRGPDGLARFSFALPAVSSLCGRELTTQAALLGGGVPFRLTNAQDLVLGAP